MLGDDGEQQEEDGQQGVDDASREHRGVVTDHFRKEEILRILHLAPLMRFCGSL